MKRTIEVEATYKCAIKKAVEKFFQENPDLIYWEDEFVYMLENNIEFESDNVLGSGAKNQNWRYALHLDQNEDTTYICIIERE